jgi:hypothetical protein
MEITLRIGSRRLAAIGGGALAIVLASVAIAPLDAATKRPAHNPPPKPKPHAAQQLRNFKAKTTVHAPVVHNHPAFRPAKIGHGGSGTGPKTPHVATPHTVSPVVATPHTATPLVATPHTGTPHIEAAGPHLTHGPHTPGQVALSLNVKPKHPAVHVHNQFFPIHHAPFKLIFGGVPKTFIALATLGIVRIDSGYWQPDGYVAISRPFCSGVSENGCQLHWRMVGFEGGGAAAQCVQYCPYSGPPPAQLAAMPLPPPPPPANGVCQIALFAQPNFGGEGSPTSETQPDLAASGWQNAVSSIQVQAGTWDVFTQPNFAGESMRLDTGKYPTLPQGWDKNIGSLQCVQSGAPLAAQ